jgi:hypothetical protein
VSEADCVAAIRREASRFDDEFIVDRLRFTTCAAPDAILPFCPTV